jgi:hypothetical protein
MKIHEYMFGVYFLNFIIMCIFLFKLTISICKCFCHGSSLKGIEEDLTISFA